MKNRSEMYVQDAGSLTRPGTNPRIRKGRYQLLVLGFQFGCLV